MLNYPSVFVIALMQSCLIFSLYGQVPDVSVEPVIALDQAAPTEDKPQSKLWFAHGSWWTILPDEDHPSLWRKTPAGWTESLDFRTLAQDLPGKADVLGDDHKTMAVLVGSCELYVVNLEYTGDQYKLSDVHSLQLPKECYSIETASISKDDSGRWWVVSDMNLQILVWSSADGQTWSEPQILASGIKDDDIAVVSRINAGVSVIWSDQNSQSVNERVHFTSKPPHKWTAVKTIQSGNHTADDHLNSTLLSDGTLLVVTKNSVDELDQPQFVLRVRSGKGQWANFPYANLTESQWPTRPVVTQLPDGRIITLHTVAGPDGSYISLSRIYLNDTSCTVQEKLKVVSSGYRKINNVTVPKNDFANSEAGPWLVLFSDDQGNVYELNLKEFQSLF